MNVYRHSSELPSDKKWLVTFGSFDGVHKGHCHVFDMMVSYGKELGLEPLVVTFDPHPREVVYPNAEDLKLLSTLPEKIEQISQTEVQHLLVHFFSVEFSQLSAAEYIESFVIDAIGAKAVVLGYDHRFGLNRQGDIQLMREYANLNSFEVFEIPEKLVDKNRVSSTIIRNAIEKNEVGKVEELLGRPYSFRAHVVHGEKRGEKLGFKTANLQVKDQKKLLPVSGIYAAQVLIEEVLFDGMLYIGSKPTFHRDSSSTNIEIHIFDLEQILYGKEVEVFFIDYLREDMYFENTQALVEQLHLDKDNALKVIDNRKIAMTYRED